MEDFIKQANSYLKNTAVISDGVSYSYRELLDQSHGFASLLLNGSLDLAEQRIAFMVNPGFDYVKVQWGIWRAGGIAVPLCLSHPLPSLQYVIEDTGATVIVVSPQYAILLTDLAKQKNINLIILDGESNGVKSDLPAVTSDRRAMILYTSGTTNLPKGVVTTHKNILAQVKSLVVAWEWKQSDAILNVLPLHHVHGIVNVVCCALYSGASCRFLPEYDASIVFDVFKKGMVNVFMAVPTIYFKLITYYETLTEIEQAEISVAMKNFRLMVSGSAALPVSVMEKWKKISSHTLLERYGMTEIGMAISNPYRGERKAGYVGLPLPGVQIRLADESGNEIKGDEPGEILVKGETVFGEYWKRPEATKDSFTVDGWFKTGDVAVIENGYIRIMGRNSVDIIKSGGYKISALEIEEVLRSSPHVKDCAVVGLENEEWGELVAAAIVVAGDQSVDTSLINIWMRERMPAYRVPRKYIILKDLPRNAMGKVTKNELKKLF